MPAARKAATSQQNERTGRPKRSWYSLRRTGSWRTNRAMSHAPRATRLLPGLRTEGAGGVIGADAPNVRFVIRC
jgi:hypothetical protein